MRPTLDNVGGHAEHSAHDEARANHLRALIMVGRV